ncbi:hypothetical protein Mapa_001552 [Marchantia paleacea]|nr:hypothetical protein Mapa_001552 [Marchantia paleacea]
MQCYQQLKAFRLWQHRCTRSHVVVLITCLILIGLFVLQRFGTAKVGFLFAPVVLLWLTLISGIGIYNIVVHQPSIFRAFSPHYAITFLIRNKKNGWIMLGGVVLSITGTEAMFADLGHFSQRSIQIAFAGVVYPSLVLAYFGQAAYLTNQPENVADTFFKSVPKPMFWPMLVIATLATIVASQAMISGAFSVINQSCNLGCFPRVKVIYTSTTVQGQIYIPEVNYALMILCIAVVVGFRRTTAIGNAYGIAVVSVMSITTCLVALVIVIVWHQHFLLGILFLVFFGSIEAVYLSSVLYKVASGGWVPLVIAAFLLSIMFIWQFGTLQKHKFDLQHMVHIDQLDQLIGDSRITRVPGIGLFYSETDSGIPPTFSHFISNIPAIHQVMVFICIKYVPVTSVLPDERFYMKPLAVKNFYQCVVRYGYNETPCAGEAFDDRLVSKIAELIKQDKYWQTAGVSKSSSRGTMSPPVETKVSSSTSEIVHLAKFAAGPPSTRPPRTYIQLSPSSPHSITVKTQAEVINEELKYLYGAKESGVVYVIGCTEVQAKPGSSWSKRFIIDILYCVLRKNSRSSVIMLNIPTTRLIEVGMIYDI